MLKYVHGSEDSTDIDVMYIFDEIPDRADATRFCSDNSIENKNIAVVRDGVVVWVYKGTVDEVNNALYMTIPLHDNPPSIITRMVERDILAKSIRVMRGSLTHASRTFYRDLIKEATRSYSWEKRRDLFVGIGYSDICNYENEEDNTRTVVVEHWKFFAFQWGQLLGLVEGKELYTKSAVAEYFPTLRPYLYREETTWDALQVFKKKMWRHFYDYVIEEGDGYVNFISMKVGMPEETTNDNVMQVIELNRKYDLRKEIEL